MPDNADTLKRKDARGERAYHAPPPSEPTLKRDVDEPEAETLMRFPKREARLELDDRLRTSRGVSLPKRLPPPPEPPTPEPPPPTSVFGTPLAARGYGFVPHVDANRFPGSSREGSRAPGSSREGSRAPGSSREGSRAPGSSPEGSSRARAQGKPRAQPSSPGPKSSRPPVPLRNGLPFVVPSKPTRAQVPLHNGLPFLTGAATSGGFAAPMLGASLAPHIELRSPHAPLVELPSFAYAPATSGPLGPDASHRAGPLGPDASHGAHRARPAHATVLPTLPAMPSALPRPELPSDYQLVYESQVRRLDVTGPPSGLPHTVRRPPSASIGARLTRAMDLPLWAVALLATSIMVVTLTVTFALLLESRSPPRVLVAGLPKPSVALRALADADEERGALRVTGEQAGIRVEIDGVDRGAVPFSFDGLEAGEHRVRLFLDDRHEEILRKVKIEAGRTLHLSDVRLALVSLESPAADTTAAEPTANAPSDTDRTALAAAEKRAAERRATFEEMKRIAAERRSKAAEAKRRAAEDRRAEVEAAKHRAEAAKRAKAEEAKRAVASASADEPSNGGALGTININSLPSCKAMLDGVVVGHTPVMGLSVSAGAHSVVFVHPRYGKASVGVKVVAGKTAVASHRFPFKDE